MKYILDLIIVLNIWGMIMLIRNEVVYHFRRRLIAAVCDIVRADVAIPFLDELKRVRYNDMVFEFWKPCRSFFSKEILKLLD